MADTHILKDPARDKETKKREPAEEGVEMGGEPWESNKTVQWVHGDRRPLGTREAEKRVQVLATHTSHTPRLFPFFFFLSLALNVNQPFLKHTPIPHLSHSYNASPPWGGWRGKVQKGTQVPLYKQRRSPAGDYKGRVEEWETSVYWRSHINHLTFPASLVLRSGRTERPGGRWEGMNSDCIKV